MVVTYWSSHKKTPWPLLQAPGARRLWGTPTWIFRLAIDAHPPKQNPPQNLGQHLIDGFFLFWTCMFFFLMAGPSGPFDWEKKNSTDHHPEAVIYHDLSFATQQYFGMFFLFNEPSMVDNWFVDPTEDTFDKSSKNIGQHGRWTGLELFGTSKWQEMANLK